MRQTLIILMLALAAAAQNGQLRRELGPAYIPRRYPDIKRSAAGLRRQNATLKKMHEVIAEYNLIHDEENLLFNAKAKFVNLQEVVRRKKGAKKSKDPKETKRGKSDLN